MGTLRASWAPPYREATVGARTGGVCRDGAEGSVDGGMGDGGLVVVVDRTVVVSSEAATWLRNPEMPVNGLTICRRKVRSGNVASIL